MQQHDMNADKRVLVLGAGQLGDAVLDALLPAVTPRNGAVSVIVSPASRDKHGKLQSATHQKHADAGATFIGVDLAACSAEQLSRIFKPFDTVINCMGFVAGAGTQLKITRAVLHAGVRRYFPGNSALITMWSVKEAASPSGMNSMMSGRYYGRRAPRSG